MVTGNDDEINTFCIDIAFQKDVSINIEISINMIPLLLISSNAINVASKKLVAIIGMSTQTRITKLYIFYLAPELYKQQDKSHNP